MNDPKRVIRYRILAIITAVVFLVIECYVLSFAKFIYDHDQSVIIAEELSLQLSLINSSFQSGDKAVYSQAVTDYRAILSDFGKNNYVRQKAADLLSSLQSYNVTLIEDSELIMQIMELRVGTASISSVSLAAQSEAIDAIKVYNLVQNYTDFRDGLDKINAEELRELVTKLSSMSNEIIQVAEKSAVCVSICPENILTEKQAAIDEIVKRYEEDLNKLSVAVSDKYNPNQLILDLSNYAKL